MAHIRGFPPIARPHATTLVLGSMPGRESLRQQRYYAHPRNSFWTIMSHLMDLGDLPYEDRVEKIAHKGVAIWDVLQTCFRSSSLDSDIVDNTITTNDFQRFYRDHPGITRVFFNGAKAESVYRRHVLPNLPEEHHDLRLQRLPSTSPAHAAMTIAEKQKAWREILNEHL